MSEEDTAPLSPPDPEVSTTAPPRRRFRKWLFISLAVLILLPVTAFALWSWVALSYSYSDGDRAGYVQKFSKKGWICKTWEGELAMVNIPGAAQERWTFSVRDDSVARIIAGSMGQQVSLHYEEKRGIPTSCFGETNHFITGVRPVVQNRP
jgi:hypothetical protein